jgi:hypothetical protein
MQEFIDFDILENEILKAAAQEAAAPVEAVRIAPILAALRVDEIWGKVLQHSNDAVCAANIVGIRPSAWVRLLDEALHRALTCSGTLRRTVAVPTGYIGWTLND